MKYCRSFIPALIILFTLICTAASYGGSLHLSNKQSATITGILGAEKSTAATADLISIINRIDSTYSDLYSKISDGGKIVIFFDPAHGRLPNGEWQGTATERISTTHLPEEYYSILISRKMYQRLRANPHVDVKSTDDFYKVLRGRSDTYDNIPFSTTVRLAHENRAFIIIAEHLNNVSIFRKAGGSADLHGIHMTRDRYNRKYLKYVHGSHSGFLTLYNRLDASGFSRMYALKLKNRLVAGGLKPNSWQFGAVGDSRFSYFTDFPVSVIYESGFISNPAEEKKLRDPEYLDIIADAQYQALINTIRDVFCIDISGKKVKKTGQVSRDTLEVLKLSRLAVYYIRKGSTKKGISVIKTMERKYGKSGKNAGIRYFTGLRKKLERSERYYRLGQANIRLWKKYTLLHAKYSGLSRKYSSRYSSHRTAENLKRLKRYRRNAGIYASKKRLHYKKSRKYFRKARRVINRNPIFTAYNIRYSRALNRRYRSGKSSPSMITASTHTRRQVYMPRQVNKAPLGRKIILPVEENQDLKEALRLALDPDPETLNALTKSLGKVSVVRWRRVRVYSRKHGKKIRKWEKYRSKYAFTRGIHVIRINSRLNVLSAKKVNTIYLNPRNYQNQQYLKNSYFSCGTRQKSL